MSRNEALTADSAAAALNNRYRPVASDLQDGNGSHASPRQNPRLHLEHQKQGKRRTPERDRGGRLSNQSIAKRINTPITPIRNIRVMSASGHNMGVVGATYCHISSGRFRTRMRAVVVKDRDLEAGCVLGKEFCAALPVYKEVMQRINEELEAVNDEFPDLVKRASS